MNRISSLAAAALVLTATLPMAACSQTEGAQPAAASSSAAVGTVHPDSIILRADASRAKGADTAQVTIVELSDFQCPYCAQFAGTTLPRIDSAYIATGKAKMIFINLPLGNHANAFPASEAAMCAGAQGKFWPMHDRIFQTQREWSGQTDAVQRFEQMAQALELDMAAYRDCTASDRTAPLIVSDAMQAAEAGVRGTPAFLLISRNGQRSLNGAVPYEDFARELDALLTAQPAAPTPPAPAPQQP